ncbi:MAG: hypothetical protein ACHRXM_39505 [Isosphaerales bacterium]
MTRIRFTIASLLIVVLFLAVGFAALREASELWASGIFTLTLGVLLVSILLAVHRDSTRRAFWIGFALFGWGYLGPSLVPSIESRLITTKALAYLDSKVPGRSPAVFTIQFTTSAAGGVNKQIQAVAFAPTLTTVNQGTVRLWDSATGKLLQGWGGTTENFVKIGHSLFALLAGWLGGLLSRRLGRTSTAPDVLMPIDA